jgi:hypothetical protein
MSFARVRAHIIDGTLFLAAAIFVVVALVRDTQSSKKASAGCPQGYVLVNAKLPTDLKQVKIKVFNATSKTGLAETVGDSFAGRGFTVDKKKGNNPKAVNQVAVLRYGPKAVGSAWLLRAYFLNDATAEYDKTRQDDVVDVVVGTKYQQLATETEVKQSLSMLGNPTLPEGSCAAGAS